VRIGGVSVLLDVAADAVVGPYDEPWYFPWIELSSVILKMTSNFLR
jgi:hypothetical protein